MSMDYRSEFTWHCHHSHKHWRCILCAVHDFMMLFILYVNLCKMLNDRKVLLFAIWLSLFWIVCVVNETCVYQMMTISLKLSLYCHKSWKIVWKEWSCHYSSCSFVWFLTSIQFCPRSGPNSYDGFTITAVNI